MKTLNKILATALSGLMLVGCNDLDTAPMGSTVTAEQKEEVYAANPDMLEASVSALATQFYVFMKYSSNHNDYGYASTMLMLDTRGYDFVSESTGYNWYSSQVEYSDRLATSAMTVYAWRNAYNIISSANSVLSAIDPETEDPTLLYYRGQALAFRAFNYHVLAQLYQFNYQDNKDKLCVPIILDTNADAVAAAGGAPRETVEKVYTQILEDLNAAVTSLEATSVTPAAGRVGKKFISAAVARGLRARVHLTMGNWGEAATDAQAAISNSGATPYSIEAVSKPSFWDAGDAAWMWAMCIEESDRVVTSGIVNWPSHMGSLNYGYASVGAWRCISKKLYKEIPATDVRKGWWLDENGESVNLNAEQQAYLTDAKCYPYAQVKFGTYQDVVYQDVNANDIPLMRVEEMYLILAEAQAMAGDPATGAATLQSFVQAYRNPGYACTANTAEGVQEEVYNQRRIELWGEGLSYFDILRLGKNIDRRGAGFQASYVFNIAANDPVLIFPIPQAEEEANPNLGENNEIGALPSPVKDVVE